MNKIIVGLIVVLLAGGGIAAVNFFFSSSFSQPPFLELENSPQQKTALGRYVTYSSSVFEEAKDKKRVYFFHAVWCPTCKVVNEAFQNQEDKIPEDVVIFKTDYDRYTELKNRFAITYQHTFVQVDAQGNEIAKWNGGDIDRLIQNLK